MTKLKYLLAVSAGMATMAAGQTQDAGSGDPLGALPIERMCSAEGALGYRFGATDSPPKLVDFPGTTPMRLSPAFAPFARAGIDATKWSNRTYAATFEAELADEEAALAAIERLARRFEQLGWTAERGVSDEDMAARATMLYIPPGRGEVHLYWPGGATGPTRRDGVRIALTRLGRQLTFSCTALELFRDHVEEALGHLPDGTPKPLEPRLPIPERVDAATCADPVKRAALLARHPDDADPMMRYVTERAKYRERLVTWKLDRLTKSGKFTGDQMTKLVLSALAEPGANAGMEAGLALLSGIFQDLGEAARAGEAKDDVRVCAALLRMFDKVEQISAAVEPQWRALEGVADREAARIRLSFD